MSASSDESRISDTEIKDFFDGNGYNSSSDCELNKTEDKDQTIAVGDIIEFYHEVYTYGHKFSQPHALIKEVRTPDDGYIRTDFPYYFKHDTEVRIVKKQNLNNKLVPFTKSKRMNLSKYHL